MVRFSSDVGTRLECNKFGTGGEGKVNSSHVLVKPQLAQVSMFSECPLDKIWLEVFSEPLKL